MKSSAFHLNHDGNSAKVVNDISTIKLEEEGGKIFGVVNNAVYSGKFKHHQGSFELTEKHMDDFVKNFEDKRIGLEPAINYNHNMFEKAAGWPVSIVKSTTEKTLSDKKVIKQHGLDMKVEWTPAAAKALRDGEYKYFSIEFAFDFVNSETQERVKNVVTGGALTNKPFLKGTDVKVLNESEKKNRGKVMQTKQELLLSLKNDFELDVEKLQQDSKNLEASKKEVKVLSEKVATLEAEKEEAAKAIEAEKIETLLSDCVKAGKIYKAEKEMFGEYFNSIGFEKASEKAEKLQAKVKFEAAGSSANDSSETELSEEDKALKLAEQVSKKEGISFSDAYRAVIRGEFK